MPWLPFQLPMTSLRRWLWPLLLVPGLAVAQGAVVKTSEVRAELVADAPEGVVPGKPLALGLLIRHAPHWHTYWKNPGDSGLPTSLDWTLPAGVQPGPIEWPTPKRLPIGPLVNYGYEGTVLLPVTATVAPDFRGASLDVRLRADWLVCKEVCIPQSGDFALSIPAGSSTAAHADAFAQARAAKPQALPAATTEAKLDGQVLALQIAGLPAELQGRTLDYFAADAGVIDHGGQVEQRWDGDRLALRVPLSPQRSESPARLQAVLAAPGAARGVEIAFPVEGWPPVSVARAAMPSVAAAPVAPAPTAPLAAAPPSSPVPLLLSIGLAFLGGLLLNLMPCVFPVLALKVLGFAKPGADRRRVIAQGWAYTVGVVLSFVALAGLLLALRAAGDQLGWGFQLQSPVFVAGLSVLFALIGLNLLGVFEVGRLLPGNLASLRARHPVVDHGLTGVLAVAVASPCTAPFMGAALGAALTQPAPAALSVFAALGAGMAAPYLAASLWPGLGRWLPRPGRWMATFRTALAFPMFATVVWLLWVLGQQIGIDGAAALLGLILAVAFAAWVFTATRGGGLGGTAFRAGAAALLVAAAVGTWPALHAETGAPVAAASTPAAQGGWQPWSPSALAEARAAGRPVFVDFTAAWCVTCQFNKRATLGDAEVLTAFRDREVVLMRADWTRRDPAITEALRGLGRSGVPVYAPYAPGAAEPQLLSEILSVAEIRTALAGWPNRASASKPASNPPPPT
jgi:thiol:disulfide interchange protein DsbD